MKIFLKTKRDIFFPFHAVDVDLKKGQKLTIRNVENMRISDDEFIFERIHQAWTFHEKDILSLNKTDFQIVEIQKTK